MDADDDYPSEINEDLKWFNETVENVEVSMKPLLNTHRAKLVREVQCVILICTILLTCIDFCGIASECL